MMDRQRIWTISYVLEATGGRLVCGDEGTPIRGVSTDTRSIHEGELFIAISGKRHDGHQFVKKAHEKGAPGVMVSEAYTAEVSCDFEKDRCWIAVPDTLKALGDLAAFRRRQSQISVVAVTGTNGKTTTKEMTASVLGQAFSVLKTPGNFNNLIGLPLTLFGLDEDHEWAVLELAMNHPGEIARLAEICEPQIGVITNIGAGHLQGVKDIDGVMEAKGELLHALGEDGTAVLNIDDERICRLAEKYNGRVVSFGIHSSAEVWATPISQSRSSCSFDLGWYDESVRVSLVIPGRGAIYNALAAAAVGYRLGLSMEEVKKGLEGTVPMPGRMEVLMLAGGVYVIDDTYNANPASMSLSIETLRSLKGNGRSIVVLGDMMELGDHAERAHRELGVLVARAGIARLYATGQFAGVLAEGAIGAGMEAEKTFVGSREQIVEALRGSLGPGDWVLVKGSRLMVMEKVVEDLRSKTAKRES
ncbi:MAG: UDP-N-acetylmuramoyl-tripeptide--D-alanyl-D-alanine ligase [Thermodesulfobacteriota bacterium]|nr:UDP-N-acetylmuramoyl-tripeptide--D-alanyl-D-alanine ligase [Thermodesulfobacteriota bacterium]